MADEDPLDDETARILASIAIEAFGPEGCTEDEYIARAAPLFSWARGVIIDSAMLRLVLNRKARVLFDEDGEPVYHLTDDEPQ